LAPLSSLGNGMSTARAKRSNIKAITIKLVTDIWAHPQRKYLAGKFIKCEIQPDIISPFAELLAAYILKSTPEK
jgi:hypothetical protein